ncbi:MAG: hypothetical protein IT424_10135 [Pirellulales bacterium]|nr:hypothetical protein [Pirellulales bacterium]
MPKYLCVSAPLRGIFLALTGVAGCYCQASAQEKPATEAVAHAELADESGQYAVETLAEKLDNPYAVTLRPGTPNGGPDELYFSESGAGRVAKLSTAQPSELKPVVTDVPVKPLGDKPDYRLGPLGLAFLTPTKLAVGTGGLGMGKDVVRVYALPDDGSPLPFDALDHAVGPVEPGKRSRIGQGVFLSLAKIEDSVEKALFVASAGDPDEGWLLKAKLAANRLSDLQPFIATRKASGVASPSAVAINPKPRSHYLLVAQAGDRGAKRDSTLGFYGPATGSLALNIQTGLYDVSALAYSPSGDLYAADFAWHEAAAGGVYRLEAAEVDGLQSVRPVKIAAVERPTGLAFASDGALYVTAFGEPAGNTDQPTGVLLRIAPREGTPKL